MLETSKHQRPINTIKKRHKGPTPMPYKCYKHSQRHEHEQPKSLKNATHAV